MVKLGIISDTHDLLRPEVLTALSGVDMIFHAGDFCSRKILDRLREFAPVCAVRGNGDHGWAEDLPPVLNTETEGLRVCMAHKRTDLPKDLSSRDLVIFGHSHQYSESFQGRTLILNPGSCGPRRFHQDITMALAEIENGWIRVTRIDIPHKPSSKVDPGDIKTQIKIVVREIEKGRGKNDITEKYGIDPETAELIARIYFTHPGVTVDGIMTKMGY